MMIELANWLQLLRQDLMVSIDGIIQHEVGGVREYLHVIDLVQGSPLEIS